MKTITPVRITFKTLGVQVGTCRATKKLIEDQAVRMVRRAVLAWCYGG